jgi:hypothetical protein
MWDDGPHCLGRRDIAAGRALQGSARGFPDASEDMVAYRGVMRRYSPTGWQGWGVGILRGIAGVMFLSALAGCATPEGSDAYPGSEDTRRINLRASDINTGWQQYQPGANACLSAVHRGALPEEAFGPCISAASQSSGFAPAVSNLHRQVEQTRDHLGSGNCRSSLDQLATRLEAVSRALDKLEHDADAARSSAYRADTTTITRTWKAAVMSEYAMTNKCGN